MNVKCIRDEDLEMYLNDLHAEPTQFLNELITYTHEDIAVTRRSACVNSFLLFSQTNVSLSRNVIKPLYKLLLDDEESIRFTACRAARKLLCTTVTFSSIFYVDKIWSHVGKLDVKEQSDYYQSLYYRDFKDDFDRELKNLLHNPIFRVEPQNLYRDFYVEAIIACKHLPSSVTTVDDQLIQFCHDKNPVELGFLYRSSKCISVLIRNQTHK